MSIFVFCVIVFVVISAIFFLVSIRCLSDIDRLYKDFGEVCRSHENTLNQYYDKIQSIHKDITYSKNEVVQLIQYNHEKKEQTNQSS